MIVTIARLFQVPSSLALMPCLFFRNKGSLIYSLKHQISASEIPFKIVSAVSETNNKQTDKQNIKNWFTCKHRVNIHNCFENSCYLDIFVCIFCLYKQTVQL